MQDNATKRNGLLKNPFVRVAAWVLLAAFFVQFIDRWPQMEQWQALSGRHVGVPLLALAVLFCVVTYVRTVRWLVLLRSAHAFGIGQALAIFGWSFFIQTVTPFRAGELLRPIWVRKQGGSFLLAVGVLIVERLADLTVLIALLVFVISNYTFASGAWTDVLGPVQALVLGGLYFGVTTSSPRLKAWLDRRHPESPMGKAVSMGLSGLAQAAHPATSVKVLALTVVIWGALAVGYYAVLVSLFPGIHWTAGLLVLASVNLAGLIWLSPGNIGMYEAAAILALGVYDVPSGEALIAAIGLHGVVLVTTLAIGVVSRGLYIRQGGHWGDLV